MQPTERAAKAMQASGTAGSAMVKTFSWCSPLEKTRRRIETLEGEMKAARRKQPVGRSSLQNK